MTLMTNDEVNQRLLAFTAEHDAYMEQKYGRPDYQSRAAAKDWAADQYVQGFTPADCQKMFIRGGYEAGLRGLSEEQLDEWCDGLDLGVASWYSHRRA